MSVVELTRLIDQAGRFEVPRASGLRLTWASEYRDIDPPRCVVQNLIEAGSLALVFGESNAGKSTFVLDIALAVARGAPWRGRRTQQGLVAYLALESANGLRRRVKAYQQANKLNDPPPFFDIAEAVQLLDVGDVARVLEALRGAEAKINQQLALVVVDTVARAMAGGDENDGSDMGALIAACDRLRHKTGATVLLIHHAGKDSSKGARGHSSLRAAVDTEIEVSGQANPRRAKVTKQRDLPSGEVFAFHLGPIEIGRDTETDEAITACVVSHKDDIAPAPTEPGGEAVRTLLRALCNMQAEADSPLMWTLEELRKIGRHLGQHKSTARDAAVRLTMSGFLVSTVGGYQLAEGMQ